MQIGWNQYGRVSSAASNGNEKNEKLKVVKTTNISKDHILCNFCRCQEPLEDEECKKVEDQTLPIKKNTLEKECSKQNSLLSLLFFAFLGPFPLRNLSFVCTCQEALAAAAGQARCETVAFSGDS